MDSGPGATFVIINYSVTNHGTSPVIVSPLFLRLLSPGQGEFDIDLPATHAFGTQKEDGSPFLPTTSDLAAGASATYSAVFRVPDSVARGSFDIAVRRRAIVAFP